MLKLIVLTVFLGSMIFVQLRGRERHRWRKQFFDHSALLAPLNAVMYLLSRVPAPPYLSVDHFQGLRELELHWREILAEAETLAEMRRIKASEQNDDAGFNSFFKEGWKRFYLKW